MRALTPIWLALTLAPAAKADTIYTIDGSLITEVRIQNEGLQEVTYKGKRKEGSVESEKVTRVEFDRMPALIDTALSAVKDSQYMLAIEDLESYVSEAGDEPDKRFPWAPAFAMWRLVELNSLIGNADNVVKWSNRLIEKAPESRYVPMAYLAQAQAQFDGGDADAAGATVAKLGELVRGKGLSKRWEAEQELHRILFDASIKGSTRRSKLEDIVATTGDYPTVSNRAYAAVGELLLEGKKYKEAEEVFQEIASSGKGDSRTLASAYCGLGECLYARASTAKDSDLFNQAVLAFMRVPVSYAEEVRYVPKALFYAGRSYQQMSGSDDEVEEFAARADRLLVAVLRDYPGTRWANEAKGYRGK